MQLTDSNHESTLHIFGGLEIVDSVDVGVASTAEVVEGSADDMQQILDMILCEHVFAGASNDDTRQRQQQPLAVQASATAGQSQQVFVGVGGNDQQEQATGMQPIFVGGDCSNH